MMMPMPFPQPPKKERSFARAIFTTLATTIFGISLVANIYLLFLSGLMGGDDSLTQSTVQHGNAEEKNRRHSYRRGDFMAARRRWLASGYRWLRRIPCESGRAER